MKFLKNHFLNITFCIYLFVVFVHLEDNICQTKDAVTLCLVGGFMASIGGNKVLFRLLRALHLDLYIYITQFYTGHRRRKGKNADKFKYF